jgi:hypothetical protein
MEDRMKLSLLGLALVLSVVFMASSSFANPALMKKHEGYPDETGKQSTAVGEAAKLKSVEEPSREAINKQNNDARGGVSDHDQLKRNENSRIPDIVGPGHVTTRGVTENQIKEGTKVNANPK